MMLDDANLLKQRDPGGALLVAASQFDQARFDAVVIDPDNDHRQITAIVIAGMGGSALAPLLVKTWLKNELSLPIEIVRSYDLPAYVNAHTLVIASSYTGNTEETISCLNDAEAKGAQIGIIAAGGILTDIAKSHAIAHVVPPAGLQPRMALIYSLRSVLALLVNFDIIGSRYLQEIEEAANWLEAESTMWRDTVTVDKNYAKQLALQAVGKSAVFYGGELTAPLAYKWKISWNEDAKNVSFWNQYSEANHNEFIGWTSHPIEKPYAIFDLVSSFEHPQILKRFEISDRLLSGLRPKPITISLAGDSVIKQLLWGSILADFVAIYIAVLNHVDPTPVALIEKLKAELIK